MSWSHLILAAPVMFDIERLPEWRILDMDLIGRDADDGTILPVQVLDMESEVAVQHDLVVGLVPLGEGGQLGTGESCEGTEQQAVDSQADEPG